MKPSAHVNKWTWKDSELIAELERCKLDVPKPFNRKAAIDALETHDVKAGIEETEAEFGKIEVEDPNMKMVKVIFHSIGEQDLPYVPVGVNGAFFYIPKEREVNVPRFILKVLNDAAEDRTYTQTLPNGKVIRKIRRVQRYPYSIIDF